MSKSVRTVATVVALAVMLTTASVATVSAANVRFGAKLTPQTQPQPAQWCDEPNEEPPHADCTWVMNEALGRANSGHKAPKTGTIGHVRLMSCDPGSFRVQVARQVPGTRKYRVVRNGPIIRYKGDPQGCGDDDDFVYKIESFATNFRVSKGDRIAIKAKRTGTLRCGSGGAHTLLFSAPLKAGGPARKSFDSQGCLLLVEWQYK
jgi:hypothetical protein